MERINVAIYGATGSVGQEAMGEFQNHPYFQVSNLYASERSIDKKISGMAVEAMDINRIPKGLGVAFFALPDVEKEMEREYVSRLAKEMTVITTSSAMRMDAEIPLIIPEINSDHLRLTEYHRKDGSNGAVFPQCNCTAVPLIFCLKPLLDAGMDIEEVEMDSYQAVSGAGAKALERWRGERSPDLPGAFQPSDPGPEPVYDGNVRPIGVRDSKEEEAKVVRETLKMLGKYENGRIIPADFKIECMCERVPAMRGHYEHTRIRTKQSCSVGDVIQAFKEFNNICSERYGELPSNPDETIIVLGDRHPQTRFDVGRGGGMSVVVGGIEVEDKKIKFRALSDNLKRGAAKGSVGLLEYLYSQNFFKSLKL